MLIVGAKGFAKEVFEVLYKNKIEENIAFFDNVNSYKTKKLFSKYPILTSFDEVKYYFKNIDNKFTIGIGNPKLRYKLYLKLIDFGGVFNSSISSQALISNFDVKINNGNNILPGVKISNGVSIGIGNIIYYNTVITHDVKIADFVEISPSVNLLGSCEIKSFSHIGANATILPKVIIGENVTIGAGAVVTKDIADNAVAVGVPARVIKIKKPFV